MLSCARSSVCSFCPTVLPNAVVCALKYLLVLPHSTVQCCRVRAQVSARFAPQYCPMLSCARSSVCSFCPTVLPNAVVCALKCRLVVPHSTALRGQVRAHVSDRFAPQYCPMLSCARSSVCSFCPTVLPNAVVCALKCLLVLPHSTAQCCRVRAQVSARFAPQYCPMLSCARSSVGS